MCGRYTLAAEPEAVAEVFGVAVPATLPKRFNIAPSQPVLAVRTQPGGEQRELVALRWGLVPSWADDPTIGNRLTTPAARLWPRSRPSGRAAARGVA